METRIISVAKQCKAELMCSSYWKIKLTRNFQSIKIL